VSPVRSRPGTPTDARSRRLIAGKYLEAAELMASEEGQAANNVVVGIAVLAGIAAGDALCLVATGSRYAGTDHAEAARYLGTVNREHGKYLSTLVRLKPQAHYGAGFINEQERTSALRAAEALVEAAKLSTALG
jgi:hypothetical protein